jgi:hypothetical protein
VTSPQIDIFWFLQSPTIIGIAISKGGVAELVSSSNREFNKVANNPSTREF